MYKSDGLMDYKAIEEKRRVRGEELKNKRIETGLTQMDLYTISGVRQKTISKIERGLVSWSIDTELIITSAINTFLKQA